MRGVETTVRALGWARVRHLATALLCFVFVVVMLNIRTELAERMRAGVSHGTATSVVSAWIARGIPATETVLAAIGWAAFVAGCVALYHLREWLGKGRRFRNQRRRAANELLRADFRRTGRI
jgi:hypothetical protein